MLDAVKWKYQSGALTTRNPPLCTGRSPTSGNYTDLWPWHSERLLSVFGSFSSFPWCTLPPAMNHQSQTLQRLLSSLRILTVLLLLCDCALVADGIRAAGCFEFTSFIYFLHVPRCAAAMSRNLQMCIGVEKWTGSQFWQAATQNDDWNGRKFCTNKSGKTRSETSGM